MEVALAENGRDVMVAQLSRPESAGLAANVPHELNGWPRQSTHESSSTRGQGREVNLILPEGCGTYLDGDILFVTDRLAEENPNPVLHFQRATPRGWPRAPQNPPQARPLTVRGHPTMAAAQHPTMAWLIVPRVGRGEHHIGSMCAEVRPGLYDTLFGQALVDDSFYVREVCTMVPRQAIYGGEE